MLKYPWSGRQDRCCSVQYMLQLSPEMRSYALACLVQDLPTVQTVALVDALFSAFTAQYWSLASEHYYQDQNSPVVSRFTPMWSHLPPEIWLSILEISERTSLLNCSLTCSDMNKLCERSIWSNITLPLYFSKRSRGFYLVVQSLLAHPERARAARRLTLSLRCMKPHSMAQSRYIHFRMPSQLEQVLSFMAGVTHLTIDVVDAPQTARTVHLLGPFKDFTSPLTVWSDDYHDGGEISSPRREFFELLWTPILSWVSSVQLHSLSTKSLPFDYFVGLVSKRRSISQVEFVSDLNEQIPPQATVPPCQYLERVANGEASVPALIAVNILNSSSPPTSLNLQRHSVLVGAFRPSYEPLGQYIQRTGTIQVLTTAELGTLRVERMIKAFSFPLPSLRVIVETNAMYSTHQPAPQYLNTKAISSMFSIVPSLITYVSRRGDYDRGLWAQYRQQWPPEAHGGATILSELLAKFRAQFQSIASSRGVLRVLLEAGQINEEQCLYWVFQRDRQGVWSMYWDTSTEGRIVTLKEREHFYLSPPSI
ncbi:hypothetical protein DL93DRAFT_2096110 [Clavulina sp. PMI_390]|nr:hypothetical protein DL93DRAFT_2096110 [Clavulina sp. PMI_390]